VTTATVTIKDVPIEGLLAVNNSPTLLGGTTTFTATITAGTNVIYTWDFGDGTTGSGAVTTHVYATDGIYEASVTATNSETPLVATTKVTIAPVIRFIYLPVTQRQ
jgi:PKD repeat protein